MKKLLALAILLSVGTLSAQNQKRALLAHTDTVINDTLHYFFNKFYYKTGLPLSKFGVYKMPCATNTGVTHLGVKFENKDPNLVINGAEGFFYRPPVVGSLTVPFKLYLYDLGPNGMPNNKIDSTGSLGVTGQANAYKIGGSFTHTHVVQGDYAIVMRNMSTKAGDTVAVVRTSGVTNNHPTADPKFKNSDGFGFIKYAGAWAAATNHTLSGFGQNTDYEFCFAPRVTYTYQASQIVPTEASEFCIWQVLTFTNTSSWEIGHRQYNLNEFCRKWNQNPPFVSSPVNGWPSDSSVTWYFEPEDNGSKNPGPRKFIPYNQVKNTIVFKTDSFRLDINGQDTVVCFTSNQFRTRWTGMEAYGGTTKIETSEDFTVCTKSCGDRVGIAVNEALAAIRVFPNPTSTGLVSVSGLSGSNTLVVTDMLGHVILRETTDKESETLNLGKYPPGAYFVRIVNNRDGIRNIKLLKE